jgi:hypothetical protein
MTAAIVRDIWCCFGAAAYGATSRIPAKWMHGHRASLIEHYENDLNFSSTGTAQTNRKRLTIDRSIDSQAAG